MTTFPARLALCAALAGLPLATGCDYDQHATRTGAPENGLKPNDNGPGGSGSIAGNKLNAGGPGAPGTTPANPASDGTPDKPQGEKSATEPIGGRDPVPPESPKPH